MNPVEIEEAISNLAEQSFDRVAFPYAFLEAFGNKSTTLKRLQSGTTNKTDIDGAVLQQNNIHIAVCSIGEVHQTLKKLKNSSATTRQKAKFIMATDGEDFQAEDITSGETVACEYKDFPNHFGFFLTLAGITTVKQIRESSFDIRATSRLNRLYVELLKDNPEWGNNERRHDMNHFMARLVFCFFAEDTDIFNQGLFTSTVEKMSAKDSSNTHEVISELFRSMNTKPQEREREKIRSWARDFPYVNGGLFSGNIEVPHFSKIARSYLIHVGNLDWKKINPDIFGSMIQAVAEDEERGALGMHYTSVSNILKVLNPLFLDELRSKLEEAGDNHRSLFNLRKRISRIRVFDPACGSGNFLVIAYKQLREIEAEINKRRGESDKRSDIPLTNFRGIELRDFAAEVARLALIIAEYQCDTLYLGHKLALAEFLPLDSQNWITCGNALRLDWLSICPPTGTKVSLQGDDLFNTPLHQAEIDFENEGGETYICGNPPYKGTKNQTKDEKDDLKMVFGKFTKRYGSLDYVAGWFFKAALYTKETEAEFAFVSTNSICQGGQVPVLWPLMYKQNLTIKFAYQSFKWRNLASNNAVVTVIIVGLSKEFVGKKRLFQVNEKYEEIEFAVDLIGPYLIPNSQIIVEGQTKPISDLSQMSLGNAPYDGGGLILNDDDITQTGFSKFEKEKWVRPLWGSTEVINGRSRECLWIEDDKLEEAKQNHFILSRIEAVKLMRINSKDEGTRSMANRPHQFREMYYGKNNTLIIPIRSSETRQYLPVGLYGKDARVTNLAYAIYDGPTLNLAIITSRIHLIWIAAVCGRMKTDFSYSNKMGWNTFPIPLLTEKNKADLTRCAEDILLAREAHFPSTIADLYDPNNMPENLRHAHERNDEVLERIYIGRRFKNDTERLEKLFDLYTKMTAKPTVADELKKRVVK